MESDDDDDDHLSIQRGKVERNRGSFHFFSLEKTYRGLEPVDEVEFVALTDRIVTLRFHKGLSCL